MNKKNLHTGHRQRLYELAINSGIEGLSDIQSLELLLTYVIPLKDTNPIAHALLDEFGSFSAVLDADVSALAKIEGMGQTSAKRLKLFPEFFFLYKKDKLSKKRTLLNHGEIREYVKELLESKPKEEFYFTALNAKNDVIISKMIKRGTNISVDINNRDISEFVLKYSPISIIVSHCHPDLDAYPSVSDINSTKAINHLLKMLNVKLVDHIIVGKDNLFSFFEHNMLND